MVLPGDFAPIFRAASSVNPKFNFDTAAGRYIVLSFFGSTRLASSEQFLTHIVDRGERFDVTNTMFFGVTNDPEDVGHIQQQDPGRVYFYDLDLEVSKKFGLVQDVTDPAEVEGTNVHSVKLLRTTFVLDQAMRIVGIFDMEDEDPSKLVDAIFNLLDSMPKLGALAGSAPLLIVPYVFEADLCNRLIDYYETHDAVDSGFMNEVNGKTVGVIDHTYKRRMDCEIFDQDLIRATHERIKRRIVPSIQQAYQFNVTRIERHIVACYDALQGAHFRAHRDNTTMGTAHRRFAVTINLNSPDYEGGEIWYPEFGPRKYKAPSGAAIIFSCSLLHEVPAVTRGKRYAFLPFLYDDAAAAIRERNRKYIDEVSTAAAGGKVTHVCESNDAAKRSAASGFSKVVITGEAGCGNPEGCNTCLTSATYQLNTPARDGT